MINDKKYLEDVLTFKERNSIHENITRSIIFFTLEFSYYYFLHLDFYYLDLFFQFLMHSLRNG